MTISADAAATFVGAIVSALILAAASVLVWYLQSRRGKAPARRKKDDAWQQAAQSYFAELNLAHGREVEHYRGQVVALQDTIQALVRERS